MAKQTITLVNRDYTPTWEWDGGIFGEMKNGWSYCRAENYTSDPIPIAKLLTISTKTQTGKRYVWADGSGSSEASATPTVTIYKGNTPISENKISNNLSETDMRNLKASGVTNICVTVTWGESTGRKIYCPPGRAGEDTTVTVIAEVTAEESLNLQNFTYQNKELETLKYKQTEMTSLTYKGTTIF